MSYPAQTLSFLIRNRFANIFCSNSNLKKSLGLRTMNKMSLTNVDPNLIIKREYNGEPLWRAPTFLVDISLADYSKKKLTYYI